MALGRRARVALLKGAARLATSLQTVLPEAPKATQGSPHVEVLGKAANVV